MSIIVILTGYLMSYSNQNNNANNIDKTAVSAGIITLEDVPVKKYKWQVIVKFKSENKNELDGLYLFETDSFPTQNAAGDCFYSQFKVYPHSIAREPGTFDYRNWLIKQGIRGKITTTFEPVYTNSQLSLGSFFANWRSKLDQFLPLDGDHHALLSALSLGWKAELSAESKSFFKDSGTMHILAVSGMHVGLVMLVLKFISQRFKRKRFVRFIFIVSGIWLFTLLSGASLSTIRAAIMLSFIQGGELSRRRGAGLNLLGGSAVLIICLNTDDLYDLGFVLSFFAVLGILLYQDLNPITFRKKWLNSLTDGLWMSLSAQTWTSPVTLYNFHFFPTWFLLANVIAVPLSTIIMYGALLWFFTGSIPYLNNLLEFILFWLCEALLKFLEFIAHLPFANAGPFYPGIVLCLAFFIMLIAILKMKEEMRFAPFFICTLILTLIVVSERVFKSKSYAELVLFQPYKQHVSCFSIDSYQAGIYADSLKNTTADALRFRYKKSTIPDVADEAVLRDSLGNFWLLHNDFIVRKELSNQLKPNPTVSPFQILILSKYQDSKRTTNFHLPKLSNTIIILDDSWRNYEMEKLAMQADSMHIPLYSLNKGWLRIRKI
jgi:competence protein ComEC